MKTFGRAKNPSNSDSTPLVMPSTLSFVNGYKKPYRQESHKKVMTQLLIESSEEPFVSTKSKTCNYSNLVRLL